jgi:hypothetical protein
VLVPRRGFYYGDNKKWNVWQDYDKKFLDSELIERIEQNNGKVYNR